MSHVTIEHLADGIRQVNQAFIENPQLSKDNYPPMIVQYLMSALLVALGQTASDFGLYQDADTVGYTGWLTIGDKTLFFAPTKVIILDEPAGQSENGELSPFGDLPL